MHQGKQRFVLSISDKCDAQNAVRIEAADKCFRLIGRLDIGHILYQQWCFSLKCAFRTAFLNLVKTVQILFKVQFDKN